MGLLRVETCEETINEQNPWDGSVCELSQGKIKLKGEVGKACGVVLMNKWLDVGWETRS